MKIKYGNLISLSEQQLIDCARNDQNQGCGTGYMDSAFKYIEENGISSAVNYPYKGIDGTCLSEIVTPTARITGFVDVPANDEQQLWKAVSQQPVSVGVAVNDEFKAYKGGVYTGSCGDRLNHAVTVVGYGSEDDGTKYWSIKNSWGSTWGEGGYMKLLRQNGEPQGQCGIAELASYPTI